MYSIREVLQFADAHRLGGADSNVSVSAILRDSPRAKRTKAQPSVTQELLTSKHSWNTGFLGSHTARRYVYNGAGMIRTKSMHDVYRFIVTYKCKLFKNIVLVFFRISKLVQLCLCTRCSHTARPLKCIHHFLFSFRCRSIVLSYACVAIIKCMPNKLTFPASSAAVLVVSGCVIFGLVSSFIFKWVVVQRRIVHRLRYRRNTSGWIQS